MSNDTNRRHSHTWGLILAAGQGTRLSALTTDADGVTVPKQYCSLNCGGSLLATTVARARTLVPSERICAIVAEEHRLWWHQSMDVLPPCNVLVQPRNRGTGNGILLPLLSIMARDPEARIVVLPSDHFVSDEPVLGQAMCSAAASLSAASEDIVLLGMVPDEPDPELGYILPGRPQAGETLRVRRFVEKPPQIIAEQLIGQGGLWNSMIFAAKARSLLGLFQRGFPEIVAAMQAALAPACEPLKVSPALRRLYEELPDIDFSRDVLEFAAQWLRVQPVDGCGWTDLGTVRRVAKAVRGLSPPPAPAARPSILFDLATALRSSRARALELDIRVPRTATPPARGSRTDRQL